LSYSLEDLALDIKNTLETHGIEKGSSTICYYVKKALMDQNFIPTHLPDREEGELEREVLYEDKDYGFCICGHVYPKMAEGHPHDHGPSWAIYGQATGETEMTDWEIVKKENDITTVKPNKTYLMKPGDVHFYNIGAVHSPMRKDPVRLLRIEGENLDNIQRSKIKAL
jgi:hypothetical protein